jgi:hypothetical protein
MKCIFGIFLISVFSGCYPIHKTIQPESKIVVVDEAKNPIKDAQVYLISTAHPHSREKSRNMVKTNPMGVAKFDKMKDWRIELLMIHGADVYYWN